MSAQPNPHIGIVYQFCSDNQGYDQRSASMSLGRFLCLQNSPCGKPPPARHLAKPSSKTMRRAACGVTSSVLATIPADTNGLAISN